MRFCLICFVYMGSYESGLSELFFLIYDINLALFNLKIPMET